METYTFRGRTLRLVAGMAGVVRVCNDCGDVLGRVSVRDDGVVWGNVDYAPGQPFASLDDAYAAMLGLPRV